MKRVLVIDNHDSFVYNLVQILRNVKIANSILSTMIT